MFKSVFSCLTALATVGFSLTACGGSDLPPVAAMNPGFSPVQAASLRTNSIPRTNRATTMTLATYNIRNLFDGIQNPDKEPEKAKPVKELQALAQSFHDINPDVVALQEVESKETLTQFRDKYLADMGYREVILVEAHDPRGIDVAIMSRFPVLNVKSHADLQFPVPGQQPQGFSRDLLQVQLQAPNNYKFTAFVAHLKSQHGGDAATVKRAAEVKQIHQLIGQFQTANPKENFVMMGDFNAKPGAPELAPVLKGLGLTDIILQDLGDNPSVYTYHPQQYRSRIDYMMVSASMVPEYVKKSVTIHKPFKANNGWQKLYFYDASDHIPTTAQFDISTDR